MAYVLAASSVIGFLLASLVCRVWPLPFDKVMRRLVTAACFAGAVLYRWRIEKETVRGWGLKKTPSNLKDFVKGALWALATVGFVVILAVPLGADLVKTQTDPAELLPVLLTYPLLGLAVGLFEETFFRGFILQTLLPGSKWGAVILASIFFSVVHFLRPGFNPVTAVPMGVGLFLAGLVLAGAFLKTRSLWLPIGIHAGWVFLIRLHKELFEPIGPPVRWALFGDNIFLGGPVGWVGLSIVAWIFLKHAQA